MPMAPKLSELRTMSDEELERRYDEVAQETVVGLAWFREEISRRAMAAQTAEIIRETRVMRRLTWVITFLTAGNLIIAVGLLIDAVAKWEW